MSLHGAGPAIRVSRLVWGALCRGGGDTPAVPKGAATTMLGIG